MNHHHSVQVGSRRRGVAVVYSAVLMFVIVGFAALTVDVGALYNAQHDLQDAADAAAMAAASAYASDTMIKVRAGDAEAEAMNSVLSEGGTRAGELATLNPTLGTTSTSLEANAVVFGWFDLSSTSADVDPSQPIQDFIAARVTAQRTAGVNGPASLFFAHIFGKSSTDLGASATAVYDDRAAGIDLRRVPGMLPFTIHEDLFEQELVSGDDRYAYDPQLDTVTQNPDGMREIKLYPHNEAPGNFGTLNVGIGNTGNPGIQQQIENGIDPEELIAEIGTDVMTFYDDDGNPITYGMTGNTGLSASMESTIEGRVGDLVGFFLHQSVADNGSNATFQISRVVFGRIMEIRLQGASHRRGFWLQPTSLSSDGVVTTPIAPRSGGLLGKIVLVR